MLTNDNTYDAIIAGAGVAGLTAAAYLCKYGYQVLLCEQNKETGGLVNSFEYNGFIFDGGIRAFENSGIIFPMLRQLGIEIEWVKNPVSIGIGKDMIQLHSKDSLFHYQELLNKHFPSNREDIKDIIQEIKRVMEYMDVLYGVDNPLFINVSEDKEYLFKTLFPWLIKYKRNMRKASKLLKPVNDYLSSFTENQSLIDIITQHFFKNTPTFFALSYFGLYLDYSYPIGGTRVLPEKLSYYIHEHQGCILTKTKIATVNIEDNQVTTTGGKCFSYKKLIWACDAKQLYDAVEEHEIKPIKKIDVQKSLVKNNRGGDSILTIFLGLDIKMDYFQNRCGAHCFYTPSSVGISAVALNLLNSSCPKEDWVSEISDYLKYTTYEISCPVLQDSALAPEGKAGLIISTLMDYKLIKDIHKAGWYDEFKELCTKSVIEILDETIFEGLKTKVLFSLCSTPLTIEKLTGNSEGAITGWAFADRKLPSETRLRKIKKSILTPIPNVYQAGQWSFSPSGLPVCILTGKLAADAIHKNLGKTKG